jgi:hypothetical protein
MYNLRHSGFLIELWWRVVCACCVYFSIFIKMKRYLINSKLEMAENLRHTGVLIELLRESGNENIRIYFRKIQKFHDRINMFYFLLKGFMRFLIFQN